MKVTMAVPLAIILNFVLPTLPENRKIVLNNLLIIATVIMPSGGI